MSLWVSFWSSNSPKTYNWGELLIQHLPPKYVTPVPLNTVYEVVFFSRFVSRNSLCVGEPKAGNHDWSRTRCSRALVHCQHSYTLAGRHKVWSLDSIEAFSIFLRLQGGSVPIIVLVEMILLSLFISPKFYCFFFLFYSYKWLDSELFLPVFSNVLE